MLNAHPVAPPATRVAPVAAAAAAAVTQPRPHAPFSPTPTPSTTHSRLVSLSTSFLFSMITSFLSFFFLGCDYS